MTRIWPPNDDDEWADDLWWGTPDWEDWDLDAEED